MAPGQLPCPARWPNPYHSPASTVQCPVLFCTTVSQWRPLVSSAVTVCPQVWTLLLPHSESCMGEGFSFFTEASLVCSPHRLQFLLQILPGPRGSTSLLVLPCVARFQSLDGSSQRGCLSLLLTTLLSSESSKYWILITVQTLITPVKYTPSIYTYHLEVLTEPNYCLLKKNLPPNIKI